MPRSQFVESQAEEHQCQMWFVWSSFQLFPVVMLLDMFEGCAHCCSKDLTSTENPGLQALDVKLSEHTTLTAHCAPRLISVHLC